MSARVAALHLYPLKGARGLALERATVAGTGLVAHGVGDREWMIVDPSGRFLTQREFPRLALVVPAIEDGHLVLAAPDAPALAVPLAAKGRDSRPVIVWRSHVRGFDEGDDAARWLSRYLGRDVRLVRFDRSHARACNPQYVGDSGAHTLFADGYPVLVIGSASLEDLNARLLHKGEPALPMNRFRPNIVVDGLPAYDEDHLDTLATASIELRMVKPSIRCQVTTTDQATAEVGIEPLPTLAGYRHDERLQGVRFGMNAIVARGAGSAVSLGDTLEFAYRF